MDNRRGDRFQPKFSDLINLAEVSMRRVIDFAKKIVNFRGLEQQDQIALLKGGSVELLFLRGVISYDISKDRFLDRNDDERVDALHLNSMIEASSECGSTCSPGHSTCGSVDGSMEHEHGHDEISVGILFRGVADSLLTELKCDEIQLLLLLLICLFTPDRLSPARVAERAQVETIQMFYTDLLSKYMCCRFPVREGRRLFAHVLHKLVDLRQVAVTLTPQISNVDPAEVQPLMNEILDLSLESSDAPEAIVKQEKQSPPSLSFCTPSGLTTAHPPPPPPPPPQPQPAKLSGGQQQQQPPPQAPPQQQQQATQPQQQQQASQQQQQVSFAMSHGSQQFGSQASGFDVASWPLSFPYVAYLEQPSPEYQKMEPTESCLDYRGDMSPSLPYLPETAASGFE